MKAFLPDQSRSEALSRVHLGPDPSSQHFAERLKAIRFLTVIDGLVQCFSQDYFVQNADYNDFSGGYKRKYPLIPDEVLTGSLADVVFSFTTRYQIPEKTILLAQIQTTIFRARSALPKAASTQSVTGQGIHTDGANRAAIVCLRRGKGVIGALNQYYAELDDSQPLCEPTVLEPGDISYFKDNVLFHYVSPGTCDPNGSREDSTRTIMIIHSPAEQYMTGRKNPENQLGAKESDVQLRNGGCDDDTHLI